MKLIFAAQSMISSSIQQAKQHLEQNEVVAIPTETVYGLAAKMYDDAAVRQIFSIKGRPLNNPLIVHIGKIDQLDDLVTEVPAIAKKLMDEFWPGPLTFLLPKTRMVPDLITASKKTVAVRIPQHPVALELLQLLDFPLVAPSANPFSRISPTTAQAVSDYFGNQVKLILDGGRCKKGLESTIVGFENEAVIIYRLGSISQEDMERVIGKNVTVNNINNSSPVAPGMLLKHYAPNTPLQLVDDLNTAIRSHPDKQLGILSFQNHHDEENIKTQFTLSEKGDLEEAAFELYSALQQLDSAGTDLILAEKLPNKGLGRTINDKLRRAAAKTD